MFRNYLNTAFQAIWKHKGFSLINISGLAIGLTSCLLLLLYINYHLNFDRHFKNIDNIYLIESNQVGDGKIFTFPVTPEPMAKAIIAQVPGVERAIRNVDAKALLMYNGNTFKKSIIYADAGYFFMFSFRFINGNAEKSLLQPNSIVITENTAKTIFGNSNPIGKIIKFNKTNDLIVSGVISNIPVNSSQQFDCVVPWSFYETINPGIKNAGWSSNICQTYVELKNGADFAKADNIIRQMMNKNQKYFKAEDMLFPLAKSHLYTEFENGKPKGGLIDQIYLFIYLAICLLLVACANFINLSTARSAERAKEIGVRKVIGASKTNLIIQFITESFLLTLVSLVLALVLTWQMLPVFNNLLNISLIMPFSNIYFLCSIILGFIIISLLTGCYPAFYLSSIKPVKVLKGLFKGGKRSMSVRKVFVVIQFTFAIFLITATICIYKQIKYVHNRSLGFDTSNMVEINLEDNLVNKVDLLTNELKKANFITAASPLSQSLTTTYWNTWGFTWPGKLINQGTLIEQMVIGYDFIKTSGAKLLAGREFSSTYPIDTAGKTLLINEAAVKVMNLKQPIGAIIRSGNDAFTVVGVLNDLNMGSPYQKVSPTVFYCSVVNNVLAMRTNPNKNIGECVKGINTILKKINPSYQPDVKFVDKGIERKYKDQQILGKLASLFGSLAIFISCLGLLGLVTYAAEQRTKEIGIRKVLGASVLKLTYLLSFDFLSLVVLAFIIAIPISIIVLNKWLINFEYRIALSWGIFIFAGLIASAIALLTISYKAIKTSMINPVKSLRSE